MKRIEVLQQINENEKATKSLISEMGLKYHHTASRRGYARAAELHRCEEYRGKFGAGITVNCGRYHNSNNFHVVEYWVK
jgi:hypothetical protein